MTKAAKFDAFLAENKITCFAKEEVKNDLHTVVYHAHMEVSGQMLPTMVVADDSIYTMIQVRKRRQQTGCAGTYQCHERQIQSI